MSDAGDLCSCGLVPIASLSPGTRHGVYFCLKEDKKIPQTPQEMVNEFHKYFGIIRGQHSDLDNINLRDFRMKLIEEELDELKEGFMFCDLVDVADALADLVYVLYGTAITFGINLDRVLAEVHRSNMTKERSSDYSDPNKPHKVVKGTKYSPPNISACL